jgi:tRNA-Thr(GGU) m(6)t(6)A37 methyltransferase TsaA
MGVQFMNAFEPAHAEPFPELMSNNYATTFDAKAIGTVESTLMDVAGAPRQADEGAPSAWLVLNRDVAEGLEGLLPGDEIIVVTWLHRASRDVLRNHPRGDPSRPQQGVFSTRSPNRPNPIGLHQVEITAIEGRRVQVRSLEAIHGTPILDIKGALNPDISRR